MSRKQFIESQGATCKNWQWSWSFINEKERIIIFGALDVCPNGEILCEKWQTNEGRKQPGYRQSREHIRRIEEDGYRLMTFPIHFDGKAGRIVEFTPELTEKTLEKVGTDWCAVDPIATNPRTS